MKSFSLILTILIAFSGCTATPQEESTQENTEIKAEESTEIKAEEETEPVTEPIETRMIRIKSPDDVSVVDPSYTPIVFNGEVSEGALKIVVTAEFTNLNIERESSELKQDIYELTNFKPGDTSFVYRASENWNNLGLGENEYTFTATFEDGSQTSTQLKLCYQMEVYYPPYCW
jgi:hypothetical protein